MSRGLHEWQLQEAKNKLSQVVHLARQEGPQIITLRGKEAAVVLSSEDYHKLTRPKTSLVEFFKKSPLRGAKIDLKRSKETSTREIDL